MIRFYISKEDISLTRKTIVHFLLENKMMIENIHIIVSNLANIYIPSHTHTHHTCELKQQNRASMIKKEWITKGFLLLTSQKRGHLYYLKMHSIQIFLTTLIYKT